MLEVYDHLGDIDAVIFDLDDTLYPEKQYVRSGYKKIAEYLHEDVADRLWELFEAKEPAIDRCLEELGRTDEKDRCLEVYRSQKPDISLYPGTGELLLQIKRAGIDLGMITDGRPEGQRAKLDALNLWQIFDRIIITDELGGISFRKPNPKAYELLAETFDVPFTRMAYIGDNISKDFVVPEEKGMKSIWVRNPEGIYAKQD